LSRFPVVPERYQHRQWTDDAQMPTGGGKMNWLAEFFAQRTSPLSLSLWAYPPLLVGPDGPVAAPLHASGYPGIALTFTAPEVVSVGKFRYELPAHYEAEPIASTQGALLSAESQRFFRNVSIYAPSRFNPDFLVTVNDVYSFVPAFSSDGSPGFSGTCAGPLDEPYHASQLKLPWTFHGFITI